MWRIAKAGTRACIVACGVALLTAAVALPASAEEEKAAAPIAVGDTMPDFELESSTGTTHSLGELKDRKSLVMVFFRGTW